MKRLAVSLLVLLFVSCNNSEQNKFQGSWHCSENNTHLIFSKNNWILLNDGDEILRGIYTTDYKTSVENTYINLISQYETIYIYEQKPSANEINVENAHSYKFINKNSIEIEQLGTFNKATISSNDLEKIEVLFEDNLKNPDFRNFIIFNEIRFSDRFNFDQIIEIINQGNFENIITDKEKRDGVFVNDALYIFCNDLFLEIDGLRTVQSSVRGIDAEINEARYVNNLVLKKGDKIYISSKEGTPLNEQIEAIYIGENTGFTNFTRGFGTAFYYRFIILGKLSFFNNLPVFEIINFGRLR